MIGHRFDAGIPRILRAQDFAHALDDVDEPVFAERQTLQAIAWV